MYTIEIKFADGSSVAKNVKLFRVAGETIMFAIEHDKYSYTEYSYPLAEVEWFRVEIDKKEK